MESFISFTIEHIDLAHWIIFWLIMLAGLNVPMSEDLLVISAGYLAGYQGNQGYFSWYLWVFAACWFSAWESYWLGRYFGPKLFEIRFFKRFINPQKVDKLTRYLEKFGIWTFIVGRFIPGGARNVLFMGSGLTKMPFSTFIFRDGVGCFIASITLFSLGYSFSHNFDALSYYFNTYRLTGLCVLAVVILGFLSMRVYRKNISSQ